MTGHRRRSLTSLLIITFPGNDLSAEHSCQHLPATRGWFSPHRLDSVRTNEASLIHTNPVTYTWWGGQCKKKNNPQNISVSLKNDFIFREHCFNPCSVSISISPLTVLFTHRFVYKMSKIVKNACQDQGCKDQAEVLKRHVLCDHQSKTQRGSVHHHVWRRKALNPRIWGSHVEPGVLPQKRTKMIN